MRPKFTIYLTTFTVVIVGIAILTGGGKPTSAIELPVPPNLPSSEIVARIYYADLAEVDALASLDIWEYNNIERQYVLAAVDGPRYFALEEEGYQLQIDHERTALLSSNLNPFSSGYRTVDEIYRLLERLNSEYPNLSELITYGQSTCLVKGGCETPGGESLPGYELIAMRLSNEDITGISAVDNSNVSRGSKPIFFLLANIHAREIATTEIAVKFIEHLLRNYGQSADITWLIDWHEVWIVPIANPDGHWLVELGEDPSYGQGAFYQRKNANADADDNGIIDCPVWPPETSLQYGVDLNRNHSFAWGAVGSSSDPCSQTFRGIIPASEQEVRSLQTIVQSLIPDQRGESINDPAPQSTTGLLISLHSFGDLVLWPWGNTRVQAPNHEGLRAIGDEFASLNGYTSCQASVCLYSASGTTDDWAYGELGIPAYTFEIGSWFMPEYSEIDEVLWPTNLPSLLYAATIARTPYETILGPEVHDLSISLDEEEKLIRVTATVDDRTHGEDRVQSAHYTIDLPPWIEGADLRSFSAVDGSFDEPDEVISAAIPTGELAAGKHIIYVISKDELGHWGQTDAVFIDEDARESLTHYIPLAIHAP